MNFVKIEESMRQSNLALAQAVAAVREGDVAPDDIWMQVLGPVYVMRDEARPFLKEPESVLDASAATADWSKPNFDSAVSYGDRYVTQLRASKQYLEIVRNERTAHPSDTSQEELEALKEFNASIKLAYNYAILIKRFAEAEYAARHPIASGPGPFGSTPGVPGYFAEAIQEINGKLDRLLERSQPGAMLSAAEPSSAVTTIGSDELLTMVRKIYEWVLTQQGTGTPPVVATEGVVGELIERLPWHNTSGAVGMYGAPGQPARILGNWQYDALFKATLSGTFIMVSTPGTDQYQCRKTVLGDGRFWVSIGGNELPRNPVEVVLSDVTDSGSRVVQRLQV